MDSYDILGVAPSATDDEIKVAYRERMRQLTLPEHEGGPLADIAKQKIDRLNEAYDDIILLRASQNSNASSRASYSSASEFGDIRAKINSGRIDDAEMLLDGVPSAKRTAEWHYLKGIIHNKRGWFEEARKDFETATKLDPANDEYAAAYKQTQSNRSGNFTGAADGEGCACSPCTLCSTLMFADCCCSSMRCCR